MHCFSEGLPKHPKCKLRRFIVEKYNEAQPRTLTLGATPRQRQYTTLKLPLTLLHPTVQNDGTSKSQNDPLKHVRTPKSLFNAMGEQHDPNWQAKAVGVLDSTSHCNHAEKRQLQNFVPRVSPSRRYQRLEKS